MHYLIAYAYTESKAYTKWADSTTETYYFSDTSYRNIIPYSQRPREQVVSKKINVFR